MDDLTVVIKETLENTGVLGDLRGRLRAEVFKALEDRTIERPKLPSENLLINELIREYLLYNNYHNSLSVLMQESKQPIQALDRDFLCSEMHMKMPHSCPTTLPLLYGVVAHFTDQHSNNCNNEVGVGESESNDSVLEEEERELKQPQVTIIKKWDSDLTGSTFICK